MPQPLIRFHLQHPFVIDANRFAFRIFFDLSLRDASGSFTQPFVPFRLDTGSDFTTISATLADQLGLNYQDGTPLYPETASGPAENPSFFTELWFSFPTLPQWQFRSDCLVSPYPLTRGLFSLNDLVPHFVVRSNKATPIYPFGSVAFQLRTDHGGVPRP